jgi:putative ABC transport system permease protein
MRWWQIGNRRADLDRELQSDLELEEEEQRERGLSEEDARYAALRVFGNTTVIREQTRHVWGWTYIECLWQDIHFALRQISHNKRFAAICILTLALGIGTQATIYSVIHAVLINPYPYRGASRMVHIHLYDKEPAPYDLALDGPQFDLFAKSPVLDGAIANVGDTLALTGGELPVQLQVGRMSGNAFAYFGVPALLGRAFGPSDGARVAVLSYHFWQSHFAGSANVLGKSLQLDRQNYEIIGVMPQRFAWMGDDLYVPLAYSADPRRPANVYARVRDGVSDQQVEQVLEPLLDGFAKDTPAIFPPQFKAHVVHINEIAIGRFKGVMVVLFFSVSFLLLLACVNVAILLLTRGEVRSAEMAMRRALGASRARILRQLLTESLLLSLTGGVVGVILTLAGVRLVHLLMRTLPAIFPPETAIVVNIPVLLFSLAVSSATGFLCGLWPALRLCRTDLRQTMDGGSRQLAGKQGARNAHRALLTVEVTLTILLLACSGASVQNLLQLLHGNFGYEPRNLASVNLALREGTHQEWADRIRFFEEIRQAIAQDRGVVSAAIGHLPPTIVESTPVAVAGFKVSSNRVTVQEVSPEYFGTLGIPLLIGRHWTSAETAHAARLALINESMRLRYWPQASPIGQTIILNDGVANENAWRLVAPGDDQHFQIIGVVGDTPNKGLEEAVYPAAYIPYSMSPFDGFDLVFRTMGDPARLTRAINQDVHRVDPALAVGDLVTATDLLEEDSLGRERFAAHLFLSFAILALVFAITGLYSIQSYLVAERRRELGVRIALGATRSHIVEEITGGCVVSVLIGTAIGILVSLVLGRAFASWTHGNVRDPEMLAASAGILFLAAILASIGPALTATSIQPMQALRKE